MGSYKEASCVYLKFAPTVGARIQGDWQQHWAALAAEQIGSRRGIHVFGSDFLGGHTHVNGPYTHENGQNGPFLTFNMAHNESGYNLPPPPLPGHCHRV